MTILLTAIIAFILGYLTRSAIAWGQINKAYHEGRQDQADEMPLDIKNYLNDQI